MEQFYQANKVVEIVPMLDLKTAKAKKKFLTQCSLDSNGRQKDSQKLVSMTWKRPSLTNLNFHSKRSTKTREKLLPKLSRTYITRIFQTKHGRLEDTNSKRKTKMEMKSGATTGTLVSASRVR